MSITCRACGCPGTEGILSLGSQPLANAYPGANDPEEEPRYPLELIWCPECSLVQLRDTVPPEHLFREYLYFSSFADTMQEHARRLAAGLIRERGLDGRSLVVEAASNDGYLLRHFRAGGVRVLGIEPAANVAAAARAEGVETLAEFFSAELARRLRRDRGGADLFLGLNVLAHVPEPGSFLEGLRVLIEPDGIGVLEVPYLRDLVEGVEFDTIYHEHVFYFSARALAALLGRHGLALAGVRRVPIHGGSLRLTVRPGDRPAEDVGAFLEEEEKLGMQSLGYYRRFSERVEEARGALRELVRMLKQQGARIAAYGAAAKGTVLLNSCGLGRDWIDFVCDRSPHKQGRRMPGVGIPILSPAALLEKQPDYVLLLAWNFADEIRRQQAAYEERGGKFIHPLPKARIL